VVRRSRLNFNDNDCYRYHLLELPVCLGLLGLETENQEDNKEEDDDNEDKQ
jgi:hypothetical protein